MGMVVEAFLSDDQQLAGAVERVGLVAAMSEGLVLHPAADLNDGGRPLLGPPLADLAQQRLIEPERSDVTDALGILDQRGAIRDHRVIHGVPRAPKIARDLLDRPAVLADLEGHPPSGTVGEHQPRRGDRGLHLGPRRRATRAQRTPPAPLVPHQPGRTPERRKINQRHRRAVLDRRQRRTARAPFGNLELILDVDHDRGAHRPVVDPEDGHLRESDEQLAHARSIDDHRGPVRGEVFSTLSLAGPCALLRNRHTPLICQAPVSDRRRTRFCD
jgi:hypothetical protein